MSPAEHPPGAPDARRPTLNAVAALAGVGRGTVSRVINGSPKVSDRSRAAVERAIAELGYVPNPAARSLVTRRTDSVALVVPDAQTRLFSEPYFSGIIRGVSAGLADAGMRLLLVMVHDAKEYTRLAPYLSGQRVDGVLMVAVHSDDTLPDQLDALAIPTVLAGRRGDREPLGHVRADNRGGAEIAVRHLLAGGRRTVGTITGPLDMEAARERLDGYRQALRDAGAPVADELVANGDFTEEGGREAMRELLCGRPDLDAVFAASDVMASGAVLELRAAGRRVPEDVAVVGFDDSIVARHIDPPLTSVRQPLDEMGRTMARLLLDEIADRGTGRHAVVLPTRLVVRESS
ncbi:LacI family DNA-binding transcriptional regulator [Streptomyces olivaceus]|uniref:LacI family DNA-binding transcriptional regulator n=1 Tax=Streptomyces olivaceus TaxID=47716 RepID=UPI0008783430|nr:LacI family DNA-binding transcriptional regulator [Streptomyces olivaceus]AOW87146.1 LacI family transcriptional regulator [Streptomyces olivaceus]MBZ6193809.1 LacI family transcriptional regulator [Streptomyces olivaceus]MBZ6201313.1 LacI family transcriptional regulator [Streptomyces olivaceus]MBZ6206883.1 LacI family transcriptional regulator [Streptomyces olivaceus]MBZ6293683.1 LacI family transcriptional regulator [Streptomyces olivaceus]